MCGRYTLTVTLEELMLRFLIGQGGAADYEPRYNIAPAQMVLAIIHDGEKNRLGELKWGLVPPWADDPKIGSRMLNARSETAAAKPAFREPLRRKRCLIPADGFYEWQQRDGGKQPLRITLKNGEPFAMAGLYETWISPEGEKLSTCTVLTTEPNELMRPIHDRMPVILRPEDEALWLDRGMRDPQRLQPLLRPYPPEEMRAYPVRREVGSVRSQGPACIEPLLS
ncbi:SOS response-associated peptidase [Paenibacillus albicereus]|uniref:Abasic site processing protein n=1 Tax=Paenibacillus albicereus TaxID=2726185 RepID=A0A6H2GYD5_9BACL|nr:SOS response-associated peptidase [Paenibacillus albicereus]QJC52359.1 SOS response-associated peptidase [Paenibacillus albicereus]